MDWTQLAFQYGVPVIILAGIGWFVMARLWPYSAEKIDQLMAASEVKDEKFLAAMEQQRSAHLASMERVILTHEQSMGQQRSEFLTEVLRQRNDTNDALKQLTLAVNNLSEIVHDRMWTGGDRRQKPEGKA